MPWSVTTPIIVWAIISIPIFVLLWIFPPKAKLISVLVFLSYLAGNLYFILVVNWSLINYWLRLLPVILTVVILFRFTRANRTYYDFVTDKRIVTPYMPAKQAAAWAPLVGSLVVLAFFSYFNYRALQSLSYASYQGKPVMLFYPLRYGLYVVTNGGNGLDGLGMNNAYQDWLGRKTGSLSMAYAVDLMRLENDRGWVSQGILPNVKQAYFGYNDQVYAPCVGTVVKVEDGHPDEVFGTPETPLGNYIVVQCFEYYVTVANFRNGTIIVKEGQEIGFTVQVGQVGSSGSPAIPHLRIFTTTGSWDQNGTPVPQIFDLDQSFHVRNDLVLPRY
jgi:hypothetical protein